MRSIFEQIESHAPAHTLLWTDPSSGLRAFLVLDNLTLGPAAGGIRTRYYAKPEDALQDALALARAMTLKCALAGLDAGGGKCVLMDHPGLDRSKAFAYLGRRVQELGGIFRTAGDLGTTAQDLQTAAAHTRYVHTDERCLSAAVAQGLIQCMKACAAARGHGDLQNMRVAVQGVGVIGTAVIAALVQEGARVFCADLVEERAEAAARTLGAEAVPADRILTLEVDIVAPCGEGGVITAEVANQVRAWAVCGAANNIMASAEAERRLCDRDILFVPDPIASAGAVIDGIGQSVMGLLDRRPLIERLYATAREVLASSRRAGALPSDAARLLAMRRLEHR